MKLVDILKERIVILDGAMGTMIQKHNLQEEDYRGERFKDFHTSLKGNNDLLVLTQPQIIKNIHREYLAAGADLIETNTFNANIISMVDYDMVDLVDELNYEAVRLAKEACEEFSTPDKPRFVVGSLGPTNKTASISPQVNDPSYRDVDFDLLANVYYRQAKTMCYRNTGILISNFPEQRFHRTRIFITGLMRLPSPAAIIIACLTSCIFIYPPFSAVHPVLHCNNLLRICTV